MGRLISRARTYCRIRKLLLALAGLAPLTGAPSAAIAQTQAQTQAQTGAEIAAETSRQVEDEEIVIGVIAHRGMDRARARWAATADYLSDAIPGKRFTVAPLPILALSGAVDSGALDFLIINPGAYVELSEQGGVASLATLRAKWGAGGEDVFGGVIFAAANRDDLATLEDLKGGRFVAVAQESFGGFQTAWREFQDIGIHVPDDFAAFEYSGFPQDAVVRAVLDGTYDAGTVRTGILETMAAEGKIELADVKVISPMNAERFSLLSSTRLYPEWSFAKTAATDTELAREVLKALLDFPSDAPAALSGKYTGWSIPASYADVRALFRELGTGPYAGQNDLTLAEIWQEFQFWIIGLLSVLAILIGSNFGARRIVHRSTSELEQERSKLAEAQRIAHVGSWSWDFATDIIEWSDEAFRIFGIVPQSVQVTPEIAERVHPDDRDAVAEAIQLSIQGKADYMIEHRIFREDGVERWISESGVVNFDDAGKALRMHGTMQDITERKAADDEIRDLNRGLETKVQLRTAELRLQNEFSEMILNAAGEGVYGIDDHGVCTFINPAACDMLGGSSSVFLGNNAHDIMHHTRVDGEPYPVTECHIYEAFYRGKKTTVSDEVFWHQDGSSFPVEYTSTPIVVDGQIKGAVVVFRDIADARDLQAQLVHSSKLATLGEMATGVAHELNQPMNVIRLAAGNVVRRHQKNMLEPAYMLEKLERIMGQTQRASDIIDHMRIFGRKTENVPHPVSLNDSVTNALKLVGEQMRLDGVEIEVDLPDQDVNVRGHSVQVEQVCLNLLTNARDVLVADGGPEHKKICISAALEPNKDVVVMRIADSGGGIDEGVLDRIFEPFFTTKEVGKGTGLGLSISYGIITEMKGTIGASNSETGAVFTVTLPVIAAEELEKMAV